MTTTSEDILAQRRVRSSELALEAARRRLVEADEELSELRARVATLEETILRQAVEAQTEPDRLRAQIEAEVRVRRVVEQALHVERSRRAELEAELSRWRDAAAGGGPALAVLERQLGEARHRIDELRGELEVVRRHTAEFEHRIRSGALDALSDLGRMRADVRRALAELERVRAAGGGPDPAGGERGAAGGERGTAGGERGTAGGERGAGAGSPPLEAGRLDEALSRLRAGVPEPERESAGERERERENAGEREREREPNRRARAKGEQGPGDGVRRRRFLGH